MSGSWRDSARPIIADVLTETAGRPVAEIKRALFAAYPFGERSMYPYKIWLDEIARQTGRKPPTKGEKRKRNEAAVAGQQCLLEDL